MMKTALAILSVSIATPATARDYQVIFAYEIGGVYVDVGSAICEFDQACRLRYDLYSFLNTRQRELRLRTDDLLFSDGSHDAVIPIDGREHTLSIFKGRERIQNEVRNNEKLGSVSLIVKRL